MPPRPEPILAADPLSRLRGALEPFTPDAVQELLGPVGRSAHQRGDLLGVERELGDDALSTLVRLFLLGLAVEPGAARRALHPLRPRDAAALLDVAPDSVRARLEVRPYAAADQDGCWWVVSDFGSDVRPGPLANDHVLGIGGASLTLAQATIRTPATRALDLGTGCGVQALHLSEHCEFVTATDVSARALRLAATTAALSGRQWDLRSGSLLEPVEGEQFDLIVANPPFVVSPGGPDAAGGGALDYRDSGLAGDGVSRALLQQLPARLAPGGVAQLLANWIIPPDGDWQGRLHGWLDGRGCDAWVWQREVVEPGEYVSLWLRDAGEQPGTDRWRAQYTRWMDWFAEAGAVAVGMGLATLWRSESADPTVICEDVPQAVEQPAGPHLPSWLERTRWLARHDDADLLAAALRCADGVVRVRDDLRDRSGAGWRTALSRLRQSHGMRWELEVDDAVAGVVAACDGSRPLAVPIAVLASSLGQDSADVAAALVPVVRDLVRRGFLLPPVGEQAA